MIDETLFSLTLNHRTTRKLAMKAPAGILRLVGPDSKGKNLKRNAANASWLFFQ
jgi:hypothetical protein